MVKLSIAQLNPTIGDFTGNREKIISAIEQAKKEQADLILFSEMVVTGYPPEDFLLLHSFVQAAEETLKSIISATQGIDCVIGTIRKEKGRLYNTAAIISNGSLLGYQDKILLPTYDVFDERRYFTPGYKPIQTWPLAGKKVAVTICEDIWQHAGMTAEQHYERDPIQELAALKPDLLLNLSASPFHVGKLSLRTKVLQHAAESLQCPAALCNQVGGNDNLIFDGHSLICGHDHSLAFLGKGFEEQHSLHDLDQLKQAYYREDTMAELYSALVLGIRDYFRKSGFKKACLGLSGGIDSALVACLAEEALGPENVLGVAMPSRFSSKESLEDAAELVHHLKIRFQVIPIEDPYKTYLDVLTPYFEGKPFDTTEENLQARIRAMLLMALSNKHGYILLSTGNKSELAMGYSTLYGDMSGGLSVISDLTKEQVYALSNWINQQEMRIPERTISKPPSAELRPGQKDSDSLPPYPIVDLVLKEYIEKGLSPEEIAQHHQLELDLVRSLVKKIHVNEYKRRQAPPGLRVSEKAFSIGRRFPIVQKWV